MAQVISLQLFALNSVIMPTNDSKTDCRQRNQRVVQQREREREWTKQTRQKEANHGIKQIAFMFGKFLSGIILKRNM